MARTAAAAEDILMSTDRLDTDLGGVVGWKLGGSAAALDIQSKYFCVLLKGLVVLCGALKNIFSQHALYLFGGCVV